MPRKSDWSRLVAVVLMLAPGLASSLTGAAAQTPQSTLAGRPNAARMGLCQCTADRNSLKLFCTAGSEKCQTVCASTVFSFLPLAHDALQACAPTELYVVLPNADGSPGSGAISVNQGRTTTLLDQPYAAAGSLDGAAANLAIAPKEVDTVFAKAIAARPILPRHFRLLFPSGSDRMVPELTAEYRAVVADIKHRPVYEVELVGHTDTLASESENRNLSINRANAVRQALVRDGIDSRAVSTVGRGDHDLLVPTAKNVSEQRNRRVEVTVR